MPEDSKWAANIAFVGNKDTVKKILDFVDALESKGEISDYTGIDGPHESLQLMLKRRVQNLSLEVNLPQLLIQNNSENTPPEEDSGTSGGTHE